MKRTRDIGPWSGFDGQRFIHDMPSEPNAIRRVKEENRLLASALQRISEESRAAISARARPGFEVVPTLLSGLKENRSKVALFSVIAWRCPALRPVLERLRSEHERCALLVLSIVEMLGIWESTGVKNDADIREAIYACRETYDCSVQVEESYVLPVSMDYLTESDWAAVDLMHSHRAEKRSLH
ncbi:hypothetical protein NUV25_18240 [Burkholderia pseudomultivorans]|uniref:hypothetical protein n=1 Tax=Burkholderia pseudomultivorans TaxID=1207504 RepID=UPI002874ECC5|nr:hypothetical protein [Burkholderia pseudomultivorans]MDS0859648.1 hypothetical protein [Burkholderia pseudomultivorans]